MRDVELLKRAFTNFSLIDGKLKFIGKYSNEELLSIYNMFVSDLHNKNIPHYRVVGFRWSKLQPGNLSVLSDFNDWSTSLVELADRMKYVVPDKLGGTNLEDGCYYGTGDVVTNNKLFQDSYGTGTPKSSAIFEVPYTEMGQLKWATTVAEECYNQDYTVRTGNLTYMDAYINKTNGKPNMLVEDKFICKRADKCIYPAEIHVFYKMGTGIKTFGDTQKLFVRSMESIFPCATRYDLSTFFMVKYPSFTEPVFELLYRDNINEKALANILENYGRSL